MVRTTSPENGSGSPKRLTLGFLTSLMTLCAKQATRVSTKLRAKRPIRTSHHNSHVDDSSSSSNNNNNTSSTSSPRIFPPKSPLPKQLITSISNKAITFLHRKKHGGDGKVVDDDDDDNEYFVDSREDFGDGGVWQKAILMGDKCQPLDFSGVIYYDNRGNQLNEVPPRSPRASPLPAYLARKGDL